MKQSFEVKQGTELDSRRLGLSFALLLPSEGFELSRLYIIATLRRSQSPCYISKFFISARTNNSFPHLYMPLIGNFDTHSLGHI